tara:strand:- start:199 stop:801 length:603 start_codon:yes stop_codon:yes gene_type:complete
MARPTVAAVREVQLRASAPTAAARESYEDFEAARRRAAEALRSQIGLAQEGVTLAQAASDKSLEELRAQAARGLASQFQAAGRRAAGGGTLAALGQAGRDTALAVSEQRTQDEARIQAAKLAAAEITATKEMEAAELMDLQRNAEEQFDAIKAGAPDEDLVGANTARVNYYLAKLSSVADPIVRQLIWDQITIEKNAGTF